MEEIMYEIRGRKFSMLIDESRDVSINEQMVVILMLVVETYLLFFCLISYYVLTWNKTWYADLFVNGEGKVLDKFLDFSVKRDV